MKFHHRALTGALFFGALATGAAAATYTPLDLAEFDGGPDGWAAEGPVIADSHGNIFGTTVLGGQGGCFGGNSGCGVVYELSPPAQGSESWTVNVLHDFQGGAEDYGPTNPLTLGPDGSIFGYIAFQTKGTVFQLLPPTNGQTAWTFQIIYAFTGQADGSLAFVNAPLVWHDGALYGIASGGDKSCNQNAGCGSVFSLTPPQSGNGSWTQTTLFSFTGGKTSGTPGWILAGGKSLYVATDYENGAIVELTPKHGKWRQKVLTSFSGGDDGAYPFSLVRSSDGTIYGLDYANAGGLAFELSDASGTWTRQTIATINDQGFLPTSLALGPHGTLIGAIFGDQDSYEGNMFMLKPAKGGKWNYSTVWEFANGPSRNPINIITGRGGNYFGLLDDNGEGMVFELEKQK